MLDSIFRTGISSVPGPEGRERMGKQPAGETPVQKSDIGSSQVRDFKVQPAIPADLLRLIQKLQQNYAFFSDMSEIEVSDFLRM